MASVLVVIVNYKTPQLTIECLQSLATEVDSQATIKVAVVNNESGDRSVEEIGAAIQERGWGAWVCLLASERNGGYAYGNNFAIRPALNSDNPPDYIWLLNPDTQVRPGALEALVEFLEQNPSAGIAGSSFENPDGSSWPIAFRFPSLWSELDGGLRLGVVSKLLSDRIIPRQMSDRIEQVDWLPGASMMIRRQVFEQVGLMDEEYFLYYEETDFCLQARRAGWSCWYVPQSCVMHIVGQSTGVTVRDRVPKRLPTYWFDSRRRYFVKNHGWVYAALADVIWISAFASWRVRRLVQRKPDPDPPHYLADAIRNSVFFKGGIKDASQKA